jgi:hypothetical protein
MVFREEKEVRREKYLGVMCCFRGNTVILSIRVRLKLGQQSLLGATFIYRLILVLMDVN